MEPRLLPGGRLLLSSGQTVGSGEPVPPGDHAALNVAPLGDGSPLVWWDGGRWVFINPATWHWKPPPGPEHPL